MKEICESVNIPVVAIGGIGKQNIEALAGSGIAGVALVSAVLQRKILSRSVGDY